MCQKNSYKTCREKSGLTAQEVAGLVGVAISSVYNWEHGKTTPDAVVIVKLAQLYGVSADQLIAIKN